MLPNKENQISCKSNNNIKYTTDKPVNKDHPQERLHMVFMDKWFLFGGFIILFNQGRVTDEWPSFLGWSLFRGDL